MKRKLPILSLLLLILTTVRTYSQETAHYSPGVQGLKVASLPPPGFYYIMHNVYYSADDYYDGNGDKADIDFDLTVFANVHRFLYVWEDVLWGANYGVHLLVPTTFTDISIGAYGVNDSKYGIGDIVIEPIMLAWNKQKFDAIVALAGIAPVGSYDITEAASPGKSFWTGMLTFGGTYYFDSHKAWHASILNRYEIHGEKKDFDVTPGDDLTFEWGIGKTIVSKQIWGVGVSGYAHWQLSEDKGSDVLYDASVKDRIFAVGPEVTCYMPKAKLNLEFRGQFEFGAVDRPQGRKMCLSLFKNF
ncbi:transporter [Ancylomarina sp. 16SWW S1-10-2]|uniref:SphA family protein n=1 Tax=Ancylomarina sp. 16SWW S1-10-2 TaxID=2499681 RepID=UPI0012ADD5E8|nr:transporter [Ancylomarina sp. 16SWW S1-10-2]MRT92593.1 transporter [Ancylomarina sp. 16SWW S1-10-2]